MRQQIVPLLIALVICVCLGMLIYGRVSTPSWQTRVVVYLPGKDPVNFVFYKTAEGLFSRIERGDDIIPFTMPLN